jgi:hypothetical protein
MQVLQYSAVSAATRIIELYTFIHLAYGQMEYTGSPPYSVDKPKRNCDVGNLASYSQVLQRFT